MNLLRYLLLTCLISVYAGAMHDPLVNPEDDPANAVDGINDGDQTLNELPRLKERSKGYFSEGAERIERFIHIFIKKPRISAQDLEKEIDSIFGGINGLKKDVTTSATYSYEKPYVQDLLDRLSDEEYKRLQRGLNDLKKHWQASKKRHTSINALELVSYTFDYLTERTTWIQDLKWMSGEVQMLTVVSAGLIGFVGAMTYAVVKAVQIEQQKLEAQKKKEEEEKNKKVIESGIISNTTI